MVTYCNKIITLVALVLLHINVAADTVEWHADGIELVSGWTLHGSFNYDADTGVMSNSNLRIKQLAIDEYTPSFFFSVPNPEQTSATRVSFIRSSGFPDYTEYVLIVDLIEPLTNEAGSVEFNISGDTFMAPCDFVTGCADHGNPRNIIRGRFVAAEGSINKTRWHLNNVVLMMMGERKDTLMY